MKRIISLILALIAAVVLIVMNVRPADADTSTRPILVSTKNFTQPCVLDEKDIVAVKVDLVVRSIPGRPGYHWVRSDGSMVRVETQYGNNLPWCYTVPNTEIPKKWFRK